MKKSLLNINQFALLTLVFIMFVISSNAQSSTANYTVTNNATASLVNMTGSERLIAPNLNDANSFVENMAFDFWFMGVRYNNFTASSNGAIRLGTSAISSTAIGNNFPFTASNGPIIAPFLGDLRTSSTGKVHSVVSGTAPNRICVIEFLNMGVNRSSLSADATFQIILNETSGIIQFIYGSMNVGNTGGGGASRNVVIGFCSDNILNKTLTVNHTTFASSTAATPILMDYNTIGAIGSLTSAANGSRRQIRFTPPVRLAPTTPLLSSPTTNSVNANWTDGVPNELGFVIYKSEDGGFNYDFAHQTNPGITSTVLTNLLASTTYQFRIHSVSEGALSAGIMFTGTGTTLNCGTSSTNTLNLTTAGPFTWSALASSWSSGQLPTSCQDAIINFNNSSAGDQQTTFIFDVDASVRSLTINNLSTSSNVKILNISGYGDLSVAGNLTLTCYGGNKFNRCAFSAQNKTIVNGNVILSRPNALQVANEGQSAIGSNGNAREQLYLLRGDMTFNKRGYTTDEHTNFTFDKPGTQFIYNNTTPQPFPYVQGVGDTLQAVLFEKIVVGNVNATTLIFAGTSFDGYMESQSREGVTIGVNSTLDLPQNFSINSLGGSSYFRMLSGARLRLGGNQSISPNGIIYGVPGSNFPGSFSPYTFNPTSTIEYYGSNSITQTIFNGVPYANLLATNGSGSGRAVKQTTAGTLTVNNSININALTDVYLGTATGLGTSTAPVNSNGPLNIAATGGLYCNANVVSGTGAFTMGAGSFLGMGHPFGISNVGSATGNMQMTASRAYNAGGNYIYNGLVSQITGAGLPAGGINDLTIDNPTTVTIATNQIVNGVNLLRQGTFDIGSTRIMINGNGILNSTTGKMKANLGIVEMRGNTGTAQNLSGNWFVNKNISSLINANTVGVTVAAAPADTLLISSALLYGVTNSVINTNSNLTLLSRDTATARFGPLGAGNDITGQVTIERYLPARKSWRLLAAPVANGTSPFVAASWREGGSMASTGYGTRITGPASFVGVDEFTQRASMKFYNGVTNNYVDVNNTNTTRIGNTNTGYYVFVRGDRSVPVAGAAAPTILRIRGDVQKGAQSVAVPAGRFVTLGNPYPSGINFISVAKTNISNTFYVWNPNAAGSYNVGAFENYTLSAGEYRRVPGGTIRNTIQSGEAIFIQSNGAAGSVTINETDKVGGITTPVSRSSTTAGRGDITAPTLEINMYTKDVDGSIYLADGVLMNFDDNYSTGMDNDDVRKISNVGDNFAIKNDANFLIVERRPLPKVTDTIKFNLANTRVNPYRLEIDPSALNSISSSPFLKDKFLASEIPISLTGVTNYNFEITAAAASRVADRFMIVFKQIPPTRFTKITAVRNADNTATVKWYTENENSINYYHIEHSTDGVNYKALATQLPTANNFGNPYYDYLHTAATAANNWYRVKATAIAGAAQFTDIVKLAAVVVVEKPSLSIYPNPVADGNVNIYFKNKPQGMYEIRIINSAGQIILTERVSVNSLNFVKNVHVDAAAGLYSCTVTDTNEQTQTETLIIK